MGAAATSFVHALPRSRYGSNLIQEESVGLARAVGGSAHSAAHEAVGPHLLVPDADVPNPELSIVIPALNEEKTVVDFVDWCMEGLAVGSLIVERV